MTAFVVPGEGADGWQLARGSITFTGAAGRGAVGAVTLFDVTGAVEVRAPAFVCANDLAGASATIDVGVTGNTGAFTFGKPVTATEFESGDLYVAGYSIVVGASESSANPWLVNADIIATIAEANVTAGVLSVFLWWRPLSADGAVALGPNMVAI